MKKIKSDLELRKQIGFRIAELRDQLNLTQKELSILSGINKRSIEKIEQGYFNLTLDTLSALSSILDFKILLSKPNNDSN